MARTLLDKVWEAHTVRTLPSGQTQLLIGLHLIHEVTTPQAFQMLKDAKLKVRMPERTFGTLDHIIPTTDQARPYADPHGRGHGRAHVPQHEGLRPERSSTWRPASRASSTSSGPSWASPSPA